MKKGKFITMVFGLALVSGALWWRRESRRRVLPTPYWLSWFFDNPLVYILAGTERNLDRIGLQPGERVLDVGSGPGRMSIPAARRVGPSGQVVAVEIQPGMLERLERKAAREGVTNIELQLADITREVSLAPGSFDRAWMVTLVGEIPDRKAALENVHRLLKPGGTLSITEMLPDPHFQTRSTVLPLAEAAGFKPGQYWGWAFGYTQNFVKRA